MQLAAWDISLQMTPGDITDKRDIRPRQSNYILNQDLSAIRVQIDVCCTRQLGFERFPAGTVNSRKTRYLCPSLQPPCNTVDPQPCCPFTLSYSV
jgi:hypothetical protein